MKWFKHKSGSLDDPFISDLMDEFGAEGYLVFFGVLEVIAKEFDVNFPGEITTSWSYFHRKLRLSTQKLKKILFFCQENAKFKVQDNGRTVTIKSLKFSILCDEYTQRLLNEKDKKNIGSLSGHSPKKNSLEKNRIDKKRINNIYVHFETFWKAYPKKIGKQAALKAWEKISGVNQLLPIILKAIETQKSTEQWKKDNGQFIPLPTTWLNQGRWEDEGCEIKDEIPYDAEGYKRARERAEREKI